MPFHPGPRRLGRTVAPPRSARGDDAEVGAQHAHQQVGWVELLEEYAAGGVLCRSASRVRLAPTTRAMKSYETLAGSLEMTQIVYDSQVFK